MSPTIGRMDIAPTLRIAGTVTYGTVETMWNMAEHFTDWVGGIVRQRREAQELNVSLKGKVCIVTGGNVGIGKATARQLTQRGAHVILACRNMESAQQAVEELSSDLARNAVSKISTSKSNMHMAEGASVEAMKLDLADLSSVKSFCSTFNKRGLPLHLLVCNAGLMSPPTRLESKDGLEMQFQVNYLSHWLMSKELLLQQRRRRTLAKPLASVALGTLGKPPPGISSSGQAEHGLREDVTRVVMLSSLMHTSGILGWEDMQSTAGYSPFVSYAFSKLAVLMAALDLQTKFERDSGWNGYSAVAVHPGVVNTNLAVGFIKSTGSLLSPIAGFEKTWHWLADSTRHTMLRTTEKADDTPSRVRTATPPHYTADRAGASPTLVHWASCAPVPSHPLTPIRTRPEVAALTVLFAALSPPSKVAGQYCVGYPLRH
eukprot:gene24967-10626_t